MSKLSLQFCVCLNEFRHARRNRFSVLPQSQFGSELTTVVGGRRSVPCPSSRRVALWLLPSSERISAAVRA